MLDRDDDAHHLVANERRGHSREHHDRRSVLRWCAMFSDVVPDAQQPRCTLSATIVHQGATVLGHGSNITTTAAVLIILGMVSSSESAISTFDVVLFSNVLLSASSSMVIRSWSSGCRPSASRRSRISPSSSFNRLVD